MKIKTQTGVTFIEVVVVVVLISILASFASPSFEAMIQKYRLESAQATLAEMLKEAKRIAKTQATRATVVMANDADGPSTITLNAATGETKVYNLYDDVIFNPAQQVTFSAIGTTTPPVNQALFRLRIDNTESGLSRYVDVVASGQVTKHTPSFAP